MTSAIEAVVAVGLLFLVLNGAVWLFYWLRAIVNTAPPREWDAEDIQARIIVQGDAVEEIERTIDSLPDGITDIRIISLTPIDMNPDGVDVHVFPLEFDCEARGKGRMYEWIRRNIDCDAEYIFYLGAGMEVEEFKGLPDEDIIEFGNRPRHTGSRLIWLADVLRMNGAKEVMGYSYASAPWFVSSTGVAIRAEIEDEITWNRTAINIGTQFAWHAAQAGYSYQYVPDIIAIDAPESLSDVISIKRYWYSGRVHDSLAYLPVHRWMFISFRSTAWAFGTFAPFLVIAGLVVSPMTQALAALVITLYVLWSVTGWQFVGEEPRVLLELLIALPAVAVIDGVGYLYGMYNPVDEYSLSRTGAGAKPDP